MTNELTCNQVIALMSFYVEDKLNSRLKEYVDEHLRHCPGCREVYMQSKKIANHIMSLTNYNDQTDSYHTKQYEDFKNNLSAYIDNELTENESVRIKKIAITNPLARKDLEDMYTFKKLLHSSFEKTRTEWKNDYSKLIINKLNKNPEKIQMDPFYKLIGAFTALISLIIFGFLATLYF